MIKPTLFTILFVGCILLPTFLYAQLKIVQFEQIDSLQKVAKKTVVVFTYTDWCKYCQAMKSTSFKDKKIIAHLNNNFYFICFNAEENRNIYFNGKNFVYKPTGNNTGTHQLADQLAMIDKKITYPTITFLNADFEIIFQHNQYINAKKFLVILEKNISF